MLRSRHALLVFAAQLSLIGKASCLCEREVVVQAGDAPVVLGDQHRLDRALAVPRHLDAQRTVLGQHGLDAGTVAAVVRVLRLAYAKASA